MQVIALMAAFKYFSLKRPTLLYFTSLNRVLIFLYIILHSYFYISFVYTCILPLQHIILPYIIIITVLSNTC